MSDPATILIVEDDPGTASLEERRLKRSGYQVLHADSVQLALDRLSQHPVDLVLLDYRLPNNQSGLELKEQMNTAGFFPPVVLVTGFSNEETAIVALRAGVRDFLPKSPNFLDLLPEIVHRVLSQTRLEQKLFESESRLHALIDSTLDAIVAVDEKGLIRLVNPSAADMFGAPADQLEGRSFHELVPAHQRNRFTSWQGGSRQSARPILQDLVLARVNGDEFPVEATLSPIHLGEGRQMVFVLRDVTNRKKLEEQLRQSQKMEAIGQLAGGIAHDFNNLLTVVAGCSELLLREVDASSKHGQMITDIRHAGDRATSLTRQLLAFSRKQILELKVLNLNDIVLLAEKLLRRLIGEDIILTCVLDRNLPFVRVDAGQIDQVILNLAVNARDAMPRGGRLTLETKSVELDDEYCRVNPDCKPGRYACLIMTDNGVGMPPEVKSRIFEPFFTTKGPGRGTGLGLAMVFGIVKQSEGHLNVYSEVGHGTSFNIYLPAVAAPPQTSDSSAGSVLRPGSETVLLVEDEPAVRKVARLALEAHGYRVLEANHGRAALTLIEHHAGPIDLVISDVVMPEMSGSQFAEILRTTLPKVPLLFMSGYTDDAVIRHGILEAKGDFLQKPFSPLGLARKVREMLDAKPK